jgi:hypothetical protein
MSVCAVEMPEQMGIQQLMTELAAPGVLDLTQRAQMLSQR